MATLSKSDIAAMSLEERLTLIDDLWDSIDGSEDEIPSPDWHKEVLDRRLAAAEASPGDTIPWEELRAELARKWLC
jgi:putative addiction module component (TIGR02574 family)